MRIVHTQTGYLWCTVYIYVCIQTEYYNTHTTLYDLEAYINYFTMIIEYDNSNLQFWYSVDGYKIMRDLEMGHIEGRGTNVRANCVHSTSVDGEGWRLGGDIRLGFASVYLRSCMYNYNCLITYTHTYIRIHTHPHTHMTFISGISLHIHNNQL